MKPKDIVTIYEDPITQQKPEGKAQLIHKELDLGDGLEYWVVKFPEDDDTVHRTIKEVK